MRNVPRLASLAVFAASALLLGACDGRRGGPPAEPPPPEVAVITIRHEPVTITTELPGRTSAYLVAEIRPQVNGIVQKRHFTEGGHVKEGDLLYEIDPAIYRASFDTAIAGLRKAEANLALTELNFRRAQSLLSTAAISREEYDNASATLLQAQADVAYSTATLQSARVNLEHCSIKAPIAGLVGKSNVTVGALATAHQGAAFATIQQTDPIYVDSTQSSANLLRLRRLIEQGRLKNAGLEQTKVRLLFEDGTPYPHEGRLTFSDVSVDAATGTFGFRMVFPNPDGALLAGQYVRVVVEEGVSEQAILVPQRGVSRDPKGNPVAMVVDDAGKTGQRTLVVERAIGERWLVEQGLAPGDRVIVEGLQSVRRPGTVVKPVPFADDAATTGAEAAPAAGSGPGDGAR